MTKEEFLEKLRCYDYDRCGNFEVWLDRILYPSSRKEVYEFKKYYNKLAKELYTILS